MNEDKSSEYVELPLLGTGRGVVSRLNKLATNVHENSRYVLMDPPTRINHIYSQQKLIEGTALYHEVSLLKM